MDRVMTAWVERLSREVPGAVGIFVLGSHVRGQAGPFSDLDFDVVVADGPRDEWPLWFETVDDRVVRIDVWIRDVDTWTAAAGEPQDWAFGLSCAEPVRLAWAADEMWRARLERSQHAYPPAGPELGHLLSEVGKLANARHAGDDLAVRLAAQDIGRTVVSLLGPLNPRPPVRSRFEALQCVLGFDVVPENYREDMLTCLGLADHPDRYAAARRLVSGLLPLLEVDATLRRYVEQTLDLA